MKKKNILYDIIEVKIVNNIPYKIVIFVSMCSQPEDGLI